MKMLYTYMDKYSSSKRKCSITMRRLYPVTTHAALHLLLVISTAAVLSNIKLLLGAHQPASPPHCARPTALSAKRLLLHRVSRTFTALALAKRC